MRLLFLDIDGVLNGHEKNAAGVCGIRPDCAVQLNRVLEKTGCRLVITSAWRYLIHSGVMTRTGFERMLQTHGINAYERIEGLTRPDANLSDKHERGKQIRDYLQGKQLEAYAVVDDDGEIGIPEAGHPFVKTDGKVGLTDADADRLIELLRGA